MIDKLKDRLRVWLELKEVDRDIYLAVRAEDIYEALEPRVTAAVTAALDEVATNLAETFIYETAQGNEMLERMKGIMARYPAIDQNDIERKVADAIVSAFMKSN